MPKKHVKSVSLKSYYDRSKKDMTWLKNKRAKLQRHLEIFPTDAIAKAALAKLKDMVKPLRGTPARAKGRLGSGDKLHQQLLAKVKANTNELSYGVKTKVAYVFNGERVYEKDVVGFKQDLSAWLDKDGSPKEELKFNSDGMPIRPKPQKQNKPKKV